MAQDFDLTGLEGALGVGTRQPEAAPRTTTPARSAVEFTYYLFYLLLTFESV
jgi:hypothetical protein